MFKHPWSLPPLCVAALAMIIGHAAAATLSGDIRIHDPSTIVRCDGRYWVFGTGAGISVLSSPDGYAWRREPPVFKEIPASVRAAVPANSGMDVWAPDVTFLNGEYYIYYAVSTWGSSQSAIGLITSPTLSPTDPNYHWTDHGVVINSVKGEKLNTIDPCIIKAPDGTLWLSYGSYIGDVECIQLNPKTGLRIAPDSSRYRLSSASEGSAIIHHGDYYYLFVNRGSCCDGRSSTYNIRMGRSKTITGPYLDRYGVDMLHGGGSLFLASHGKVVGPGHFGLYEQDGLQRFSCHYEWDADRDESVLATAPLLWIDGWPAAGHDARNGVYQIVCQRTGNVLQVAGLGRPGTPVRQASYITSPSQKWQVTSLGAGQYKITGLASGLALQADGAALQIGDDTGGNNQIWTIEQIGDGSYRILDKDGGLALTGLMGAARRRENLDLAAYQGGADQQWLLKAP
jgi:arabinan endo-1,5-alpha-L-arabinosidase